MAQLMCISCKPHSEKCWTYLNKAAHQLKIPLRQHFILQRIAATNREDK
jgi:hypothetical protein